MNGRNNHRAFFGKKLVFFFRLNGCGNTKYPTEKLSAAKKYPTFYISMRFQVIEKLSTTKKKHFSMEIWHTWSIEDNFDQFFINISILVPTQVIARLNQGWKWTKTLWKNKKNARLDRGKNEFILFEHKIFRKKTAQAKISDIKKNTNFGKFLLLNAGQNTLLPHFYYFQIFRQN